MSRKIAASRGAERRLARSPALVTALLALLTAVGPISTDMYLPAFPVMRLSLHAQPGQTQLTLAAWFLGLSFGQLTHGHLADQYGRRLPLLIGTILYTVASIGCALVDNMTDLSWWRLWAAFGGAASLVIPRAIIADVAKDGAQAARMLSRMVIVMGVVPALAPIFGGLVAEYWNWRVIFWIAAFYGAFCSALIYLLLPDTLRHRRRRLKVSETAVRYVIVWRNRVFRTYVLQGGFATFSLFAFLGGAPGVFQMHYNLRPEQFGCVFILNTIGYVGGTQANARLMSRMASDARADRRHARAGGGVRAVGRAGCHRDRRCVGTGECDAAVHGLPGLRAARRRPRVGAASRALRGCSLGAVWNRGVLHRQHQRRTGRLARRGATLGDDRLDAAWRVARTSMRQGAHSSWSHRETDQSRLGPHARETPLNRCMRRCAHP